MKNSFLFLALLMVVMLSSCAYRGDFSKKKYLHLGSMSSAKNEITLEVPALVITESNTINEMMIQGAEKPNLMKVDSVLKEDLDFAKVEAIKEKFPLPNCETVASKKLNLIEEKVSPASEKQIEKFRSNKRINKIKETKEPFWGSTILITLGVIILLPLVLLVLLVLYLFFPNSWQW